MPQHTLQHELVSIARDLTEGLSHADRFSRLLAAIRRAIRCDAAALLRHQQGDLIPLATNGLTADVLGRHFQIAQHPRFAEIAASRRPVRFDCDSELPDPYDGLVAGHQGALAVHACIGLPLYHQDRLIGALTIDGLAPNLFDQVSDQALQIIMGLAGVSLNVALVFEQLEQQARQADRLAQALVEGALERHPHTLVGKSNAMAQLRQEIEVVADSDLTVLIRGETGTGKELVAHRLHQLSPRAGRPLIYVNCAALPESLAESELFGHRKGAFTGAISHRSGKFELADGGTLFLDEVGELPLPLQAKLLRVLQTGEIQRIGEDRLLRVDVRVLAATNRDLEQAVAARRFRADLFHRLSVYPILTPPLRARDQDIPLLAGFFAERCRHQLGLATLRFAPQSLDKLARHPWPGNVRELEHAVNTAALRARAEQPAMAVTILPEHCVLQVPQGEQPSQPCVTPSQQIETASSLPLREALDQFQRRHIQQSLEVNGHNWAATARQLGIDPGNLHRLAKRLGLK